MTRTAPSASVAPEVEAPPKHSTGFFKRMMTSVGPKLIPHAPTAAKVALSGGRRITIDGNTLDPTLQMMLSGQKLAGIDGMVVSDDVAVVRAHMRDMALALSAPPIDVAVQDISLPGPAGTIAARHYKPASDVRAPLLVFYHGAGFALGDLEIYDSVCRLTCRDAGVHVLSIDYRLAPEHPAPAAVEDAYGAFRWAYEHASELGADPKRVAVGGDSAGGTLAAVVSHIARDEGGPAPVLQWLIYPATDRTTRTQSERLFARGFLLTAKDIDWFYAQYLQGFDPADPRVSPLRAESLSGLAPASITVGGFDPLRDEVLSYAAALQAAGTVVDLRTESSLIHGFVSLSALGGGSAIATAELISALRAHLTRG